MKKDKRPIAVWKQPTQAALLIKDVDRIMQDITDNTPGVFGTPTGKTLLLVTADNAALNSAQTIALTRAAGAAGQRDIKLKVVLADMHDKLSWVQSVMDAAPDQITAIAICHASGFHVKVNGVFIKPEFSVKQGMSSGEAVLTSKSAAKKAAYEWRMSKNNADWTPLPLTLVAKTTVTGLDVDVKMFFQKRTTAKGVTSAWSLSLSITPQ